MTKSDTVQATASAGERTVTSGSKKCPLCTRLIAIGYGLCNPCNHRRNMALYNQPTCPTNLRGAHILRNRSAAIASGDLVNGVWGCGPDEDIRSAAWSDFEGATVLGTRAVDSAVQPEVKTGLDEAIAAQQASVAAAMSQAS